MFGAGNGGSDHIGDDNDVSPLYPCNLDEPNVVCVAATDQDDKLASFSNYGDKSVDLAAPGVNILAATIGTSAANSYDFVDGTSFSSPIVAGAAALYRSRYPRPARPTRAMRCAPGSTSSPRWRARSRPAGG